ncbi:FAD-binding oxidoreductase [Vannielia litorea]|uniref:Decaprenylphospho-beta-D-ribofuranose 2-oxidase n=1 Tax=Vannielia litorea TaxID=1217970 RepID=A0A1N6EAZ4_9RHOB|nr:FAD-binding oxidoreductase [Vannielia litorea]SIN80198.1 decaprenylphospho-beta-D-ribofuranose 2-oxidase [Vannielia litorea]
MSWKKTTWTGWGRVLSATGELARPERSAALAALATEGPAIGNARSYGDAALVSEGRAVIMARLDKILDFDAAEAVIHVEAGATISDLARILAPRGFLPAVMPGTGFATVGGCIAMDVHGKNHHGAGSFGQHVTEITLATGKVLTPQDPLFAATVGGLGQTGPIGSARLRLLRAKVDVMMVTERRAENLESFLDLLDESEATYTVGWIDATATGESLGRGILEEGETGAGLVPSAKRGRRVPFNAPGWALAAPVVRLFNKLYYSRVPAAGRTLVKPIDDFFFPLDRIHDWNRLYGSQGFHQFQCVVPVTARGTLRSMLEAIASSGLASPLAVLKRMGAGRAGHLSFPMEGYTLAVDFRNRTGTRGLIQELIAETKAAGGRIYFAKDSVARAEDIPGMYPELSDWAAAVNAADPEHRYETDLTRRLSLRSTK